MFTGIILDVGTIEDLASDSLIVSYTNKNFDNLEAGTSISVDGICLTLKNYLYNNLEFQISDETLNRTNLTKNKSNKVNLELPATLNSFLSGHIVQGHIDDSLTLSKIDKKDNNMWNFYFKNSNSKYIVDKGSITINGISLTVVNPIDNSFHVSIISETYNRTNLQFLSVGDSVNVEYDIIIKYLEKINL